MCTFCDDNSGKMLLRGILLLSVTFFPLPQNTVWKSKDFSAVLFLREIN